MNYLSLFNWKLSNLRFNASSDPLTHLLGE